MNRVSSQILVLLSNADSSMDLGTIASRLDAALTRRTLQRNIIALIEKGLIVRDGRGRATVYRLAERPGFETSVREMSSPYDDYSSYIPLSAESRQILAALCRPMGARMPEAFDRSFIDRYIPGKTFHLDAVIRKRLKNLGETDDLSLPAGTYGRHILDRLLIDLSFASSRLEGNTYSLLDTERLLVDGISAEGKAAEETQMILNHKRAVEMLVEQAAELSFNRYTILNLHGLLSENLLPDPFTSGALRRRAVQIGGSVYLPPEVPQTIEDVFMLILEKATAIADPFEQAFFVLVYLPWLQPFEDANKRVARMAANIPFVKQNLCPLTFLDVPREAYVEGVLGVYELSRVDLLRDVFVWAYERSTQKYLQVRKVMAQPDPLRLKYREQIYAIVREIVTDGRVSYTQRVEAFALAVPEEHRADFIAIVLEELKRLHEGILARYRIRPSEFEQWRRALICG